MWESKSEPSSSSPPTTRWSLVLAATSASDDARKSQQAFDELCRTYWSPVCRFIMRRGHSAADAEDATQDFFLRLSNLELLKRADPLKGRFRCLVFAALRNALSDAGDRARALKRGGNQALLSIDEWLEEGSATSSQAAQPAPEQQMFDYDWAAQVVRQALLCLEEAFATRNKTAEFQELRKFLNVTDGLDAYTASAQKLKVPLGTLKSMVHRIRVQYGTLLRNEVAQTICDPTQLDEEVRYLCSILSARPDLSHGCVEGASPK